MTVETSRKKEMIEETATKFQRLTENNKMFILGYMIGVQQRCQNADKKDTASGVRI